MWVNIMSLLTESEFRRIEAIQTTAAVVFCGSFVLLIAMVMLDCDVLSLLLGE